MSHKEWSFIKSGIRIVGYLALMVALFENSAAVLAGAILIVSELVGVWEEVGE